MQRMVPVLALVAISTGAALLAAPDQTIRFYPIADVRPGQIAVGRTVFGGHEIEEFRAEIVSVLTNMSGPKRSLILARLSGGPLAATGVIQGMSGSPVYIDGRLVGAVSYSIGSFPKEALAGITPIAEMTDAIDDGAAPAGSRDLALAWPATHDQVFSTLSRVISRATAPSGGMFEPIGRSGAASLAGPAPTLRPIGAALALGGVDVTLARDLAASFAAGSAGSSDSPRQTRAGGAGAPLRPGDALGVAMVRGDLQMGATGTVTHVDGPRVYGFGHPFLNLGSTRLAMTRAQVYTVVPSLDSSIKIATLGPVIGTMTQDRATGIGGAMGAPPRELALTLTIKSPRAADRRLQFQILHDEALTPLFTYIAVVNSLLAFERQLGAMTIEASGHVSFGEGGRVAIDDIVSGDTVLASAGSIVSAPLGIAATNEFRPSLPDAIDLTLRVSEDVQSSTIERAWLDTTRPRAGETHTLNVLLRHHRGGTQTITMPVTMPSTPGPVTLLVADAPTLAELEERELQPGRPTSWTALVDRMNSARRNNRVYVRLISESRGAVVAGATLPALPASVRSVLDDEKSAATAPVSRTVIAGWEERLPRAIRGSRELALIVTTRAER